MDPAAGGAPRPGQPPECLRPLPPGPHGRQADDQDLRRRPLGRAPRGQDGTGRAVPRSAGVAPPALRADAREHVGRGVDAPADPPRPRPRGPRVDARHVRLARPPPRGSRHLPARGVRAGREPRARARLPARASRRAASLRPHSCRGAGAPAHGPRRGSTSPGEARRRHSPSASGGTRCGSSRFWRHRPGPREPPRSSPRGAFSRTTAGPRPPPPPASASAATSC